MIYWLYQYIITFSKYTRFQTNTVYTRFVALSHIFFLFLVEFESKNCTNMFVFLHDGEKVTYIDLQTRVDIFFFFLLLNIFNLNRKIHCTRKRIDFTKQFLKKKRLIRASNYNKTK